MKPIVLDLPMPPSVNAIWRSRRGANGKPSFYLDPKYQAWQKECDGEVWVAGWVKGWTKAGYNLPLSGPVHVSIILGTQKRGDADNRIKACLDYLQRAAILVNDKQVEKVSAEWGVAPSGCRITVEPSLSLHREGGG